MLLFNPGRRIPGIPFMGDKMAIYDPENAQYYDMSIDVEDKLGRTCYRFSQKVKPGMESKAVIENMDTWFDETTMQIVARDYHLKYDAAVYDFDVYMSVEMTETGGLTVPAVLRYSGNWKAVTKKRERGEFTATLSGFSPEK